MKPQGISKSAEVKHDGDKKGKLVVHMYQSSLRKSMAVETLTILPDTSKRQQHKVQGFCLPRSSRSTSIGLPLPYFAVRNRTSGAPDLAALLQSWHEGCTSLDTQSSDFDHPFFV